jgi:hypothetical protein
MQCLINYGALIVRAEDVSISKSNTRFTFRYIGYSTSTTAPWPYLPNLEAPTWTISLHRTGSRSLLFVTLLSNFVPLSLYVTIELVTLVMRVLINQDVNMYDAYTDTASCGPQYDCDGSWSS